MFTLALALGVQSSVIPLGGLITQVAGLPLAHNGILSPLGLPLGGSIVVGPHPAAIPAAVSLPVHAGIPAAIHAACPSVVAAAPAVVAAPAIVGGGSYVAKTRGAIHTAPLAGHINSVANVNVAPAPGTH